MALDRQSIEKKDFPIARRGYDPDAVDAHLKALADEIDELERSARRPSESLAATVSEQVRSIVEAAETTAADVQRQAKDEASEYVGKVAESTSGMLERIGAMENELNALIESLRAGSNRLNADLQLLEGNLASVKDAAMPRPRFEPEREGPAPPQRPAPAVPSTAELTDVAGGEVLDDAGFEPSGPSAANGGDDESARLIALNMVMNNTPREEIERYLAENFRLSDRRSLLDEVFASFEG